MRLAKLFDGKLKNDDKQLIRFQAIASVPCFELWLLLHHEMIEAPLHRDDVMGRLKRYMPGYKKGAGGTFAVTCQHLVVAIQRADTLVARFTADDAPEPYTAIGELVKRMTSLRR